MSNLDKQLCALCGVNEATTRDHIPPKCIFAKPRPQLITIPACEDCNKGTSNTDEQFMMFLSLKVGTDNEGAAALWEKQAVRTFKHNRRLQHKIMSSVRQLPVKTKAGIYLGETLAVPWNDGSHDLTIEKMVRGLYYYHFDDILGDRINCKVQYLSAYDEKLAAMSHDWELNEIGDGFLAYKYGRCEEYPLASFWIFQFYNGHWASGYTMPPELQQA